MAKAKKELENFRILYDKKFFDELFKKLNIEDKQQKIKLEKSVLTAAKSYHSLSSNELNILPTHKIKKEIKIILKQMNDLEKRLSRVFKSGAWGAKISSAFVNLLDKKYPDLKGMESLIYENQGMIGVLRSKRLLLTLEALNEAIKITINNKNLPKVTQKKHQAIEYWVLALSSIFEEIQNRPFKQRHYDKGYAQKKGKLYDSDILLFILKPLNPKATISQMETAIKETKEERRNPPWEFL